MRSGIIEFTMYWRMAIALPFATAQFDVVTMASALHWVPQDAALAEASRVCKAGGRLIVYDSLFTGHMIEDERLRMV